jgi:EmrB/QacA subfamily drug resistance transporter
VNRRWQVFAISVGGALIAFLDVTIVSVTFPALEAGFPDASRAELSWVLSGYNIVFAALLVPAGRLADVAGPRRLFLAGVLGFTLASLACAAAPSVEALIAARLAQAIAAAAVIPSSLAMVLAEFPVAERVRGAGLWAAAAAVSAGIGPTLGGLLTEAGSWQPVFLVNLPIGIACLLGGHRLLREAELSERPLPDLAGSALIAGAVGFLVLAVVEGNRWGWGSTAILGSLVLAILLLLAFLRLCRRHPAPVVDLELFKDRAVAVGNLGTLVFSAAVYGIVLVNVFFLDAIWGYAPVTVGLALTPAPIAMAISAAIGGRLAERYGQRRLAVAGAVLFAGGAAWFATALTPEADLLGHWLPGAVLTGTGAGLAYPALGSAAVATLEPNRFGVGSAMNAMFRQLGAAVGVAAVVAVLGSSGAAVPADYQRGWALLAAIALAAALTGLGLKRQLAAEAPPALLEPGGRAGAHS